MVEIVSHGRRAKQRDYEEKREEYLELGIREYWIVDPEERHVVVLNRIEDHGQVSWSECLFTGAELHPERHCFPDFRRLCPISGLTSTRTRNNTKAERL